MKTFSTLSAFVALGFIFLASGISAAPVVDTSVAVSRDTASSDGEEMALPFHFRRPRPPPASSVYYREVTDEKIRPGLGAALRKVKQFLKSGAGKKLAAKVKAKPVKSGAPPPAAAPATDAAAADTSADDAAGQAADDAQA